MMIKKKQDWVLQIKTLKIAKSTSTSLRITLHWMSQTSKFVASYLNCSTRHVNSALDINEVS